MDMLKRTPDYASASKDDCDLVDKLSWMIRPCPLYNKEFSMCTSFKARFDQYYTNGEITDCIRWEQDKRDCTKYTKEGDISAGARIIKHEQQRIAERMKSFEDNDVMKIRERRPPANWNAPLAPHILETHKDSYLADKLGELSQPFDAPKSSCVIS